jgi:hypothetical protein
MQVCRSWHAWIRKGPAYSPTALHATLFGNAGGHMDIVERVQVRIVHTYCTKSLVKFSGQLKSYRCLQIDCPLVASSEVTSRCSVHSDYPSCCGRTRR